MIADGPTHFLVHEGALYARWVVIDHGRMRGTGLLLTALCLPVGLASAQDGEADPSAVSGTESEGDLAGRAETADTDGPTVTADPDADRGSSTTAPAPELPAAPASPRPPPSVGLPIPVEVVTESPGAVTLHNVIIEGGRSFWTGRRQDSTQPLCTAPCQIPLAPGTYRFAISDGGDPQRVSSLTDVRAPLRLHLEWENRESWRIAGWATLGATALATLALVISGAVVLFDDLDAGVGLVTSGVATLVLGVAISLPLGGFENHAELRVERTDDPPE